MRAVMLVVLVACSPPSVELPSSGPGIGFDDLRYSPRLHRVLVPAGRSGNLDLVDPDTYAVQAIGGFSTQATSDPGEHDFGVTSVDDTGTLLAVTDRTSRMLSLVDPETASIVMTAPLGASPDYVRWVEATRELWVTEPGTERIEVFATEPALAHLTNIAVPGGPESLVIDRVRGVAYTHLWDGGTVGIDVRTRVVGPTWSNRCNGSRGIAVDEDRGFVFAGCAEGRATVLDATDGHVIDEVWPVSGVDVIDWSPSRRHLYLAGQISGNVAIVGVSSHGEVGVLGIDDGAIYGHCVTTDDAGQAFVCDPRHGQLRIASDPYDPVTR